MNEIKYKLKSKLTKKYLENYKDIINIYNSTINIQYSKNNLIINGLSKYSINDFKNALDFKIEKVKDNYNFDTNIDLNKTKININELNYKKSKDKKAILEISGKYQKDKIYCLKKLILLKMKII